MDGRKLREAFGAFATGVCVVTMRGPRGAIGLTINSFASVSLEPPLLAWSVNRRSSTFQGFATTDHFCVHVMDEDHKMLCARLAGRDDHELDEGLLASEPGGAPILRDAAAWFECAAHARHAAGDHLVLLGEVLRFRCGPPRRPLVYYRGQYRSLEPAG